MVPSVQCTLLFVHKGTYSDRKAPTKNFCTDFCTSVLLLPNYPIFSFRLPALWNHHWHGHMGIARTVADGWATSSEHTLNPQTPRVKRETLLTLEKKQYFTFKKNTFSCKYSALVNMFTGWCSPCIGNGGTIDGWHASAMACHGERSEIVDIWVSSENRGS